MAKKKETKEVKKPSKPKKVKEQKILKCKLSDVEFTKKANELAKSIDELSHIEDEKKTANAVFNSRLKQVRSRIMDLSEAVKDKAELRTVDCIKTLDYKFGNVTVIRTDTNETIEERGITEAERQMTFV